MIDLIRLPARVSAFGLLLLLVAAGLWAAVPPAATADGPLVLRVIAPDRTARAALAARFDLLEASEGAALFALSDQAGLEQLRAEGWEVVIDEEQTALLPRDGLAAFDPAYRIVPEIEAEIMRLATTYPTLAQAIDYGDSYLRTIDPYGGHDLIALRIANPNTPPQPTLTIIAALHARELTTSEIALRFANEVLAGYGREPWATWLLDEHDLLIVPVANPDGRRIAEQGYLQRKNRNPGTQGLLCREPPQIGNQLGVDLNRNFGYLWGTINRPTSSPCSETYPGTAAESEPETQALRDLLRQTYPARSPSGEAGAPSGVMISLHSYGQLVLWPWGYTETPPPDSAGLARLGTIMAEYSGASAQQAIGLYPTSGTLEDWSYSTFGIASYTFEIGESFGECGGFTPPYRCLDGGVGGNLWPRWAAALRYAAHVSAEPLRLPSGPAIGAVALSISGERAQISAAISATNVISGATLWIGRDQAPLAMQASDGAFDSANEVVLAEFDLPRETPPYLVIRAEDGQGSGPAAVLAVNYRLHLPLVR